MGAYCASGARPADIPARPSQTYANSGWLGYGDWLGTGTVSTRMRKFRSFKRARAFARSLGLKSQREWSVYCKSGKKPRDIPQSPHEVYADVGWLGLGDWLGTGTVASRLHKYRSFVSARAFVHGLGLKSSTLDPALKSDDKPESCYCSALPTGSGLCIPYYGRWLAAGARNQTGLALPAPHGSP
jgi:hypothetical protein